MAAVTKISDPLLTDHLTKVQLRLIEKKLAEEREKLSRHSGTNSRSSSNASRNSNYHFSGQKGYGYLDKHQRSDDHLRRPKSFTGRQRLSPLSKSPSRQSLPADMGSQRHVIEHQFHQIPQQQPQNYTQQQQTYQQPHPQQPYPLPPPPQPTQLQPFVQQPQQAPPIYVAPPTDNKGNYKQEMMEMMMFQNAQVHQMIMQQLMLSAIPKSQNPEQQMLNKVVDKLTVDRGSHHHHYQQPQQQPNYYLPPIAPSPIYPMYGRYPMEVDPLRVPRERIHSPAKSPKLPKLTPKKPQKRKLEFPGPYALRKFRHVAYAAWFTRIIKRYRKSKKRWKVPVDSDFLFNIRLKEAVTALHNIYRNPAGDIYPLIMFLLSSTTRDLSSIMSTKNNDERKMAVKETCEVFENLVKYISTIMPPDGALGTHHKSHVVDMTREGKMYPKSYLLQIEKDKLYFDATGRSTNINDAEIYILLVDLFYVQSLVKTLFLKPTEYQLIEAPVTVRAQRNMKLMSTLFIYLIRKIMVAKNQKPLDLPVELINQIHSDNEMVTALKLTKKSFDVCDDLIRKWGRSYVDKIKAVR